MECLGVPYGTHQPGHQCSGPRRPAQPVEVQTHQPAAPGMPPAPRQAFRPPAGPPPAPCLPRPWHSHAPRTPACLSVPRADHPHSSPIKPYHSESATGKYVNIRVCLRRLLGHALVGCGRHQHVRLRLALAARTAVPFRRVTCFSTRKLSTFQATPLSHQNKVSIR